MGRLVDGTDGIPAEEVGPWVDEKLFIVTEYIKLSSGPRRKFIGPGRAGATYFDLFCGPGQGKIRDSNRYVDGAAVAAWKAASERRSPFTAMYIADKDAERRQYCAARLRALGAPVNEVSGTAAEAARAIAAILPASALHFAFLDPYSLGALSFDLLRRLASFQRMDILVLISAMDLFRNIEQQSADEDSREFDDFAPGWREHVPLDLPQSERWAKVMEYWARCVAEQLGLNASSEMHAVKNRVNRLIYWLLLLHRHTLAQKFWEIVLKARPQTSGDLF
jgi:three-Cys-motif partner protein